MSSSAKQSYRQASATGDLVSEENSKRGEMGREGTGEKRKREEGSREVRRESGRGRRTKLFLPQQEKKEAKVHSVHADLEHSVGTGAQVSFMSTG